MRPEQFRQFLTDTFLSYRAIIKLGGSLYVCHPSSWQREFQNAMDRPTSRSRCQIVWAENHFAWGFGWYKSRHEPIFVLTLSAKATCGTGTNRSLD
jgi:hypothetical protein